MNSPENPATKLEQLIADIRVAMLSTVTVDGTLHTRPMATTQVSASAEELWFFTAHDSAKTSEIDSIHRVALSYADPGKQRYVAISGTARILRDEAKARELWNPWAEAWFPAGPTDPAVRLVCVTPFIAEYWDASGHRLALLFETVKAKFGGTPKVPPTEHASINLKR